MALWSKESGLLDISSKSSNTYMFPISMTHAANIHKCGQCGLPANIRTDCAGQCDLYEKRVPKLNDTVTAVKPVCLPKVTTTSTADGSSGPNFNSDRAAVNCDGQVGSGAMRNK